MRFALVSALVISAPQLAGAAAFRVESRTEAHLYGIRSLPGTRDFPRLLPRRRLVQSLSLSGMELVRDEDLSFDTSLRLWTDLGVSPNEDRRLDGINRGEVDLLFAYATWNGAVQGRLDARVGRQ